MTTRHARLAVLLREAERTIGEAAFAAGGSRLSSGDAADLAEALDELARALRDEADRLSAEVLQGR